MDVAGEGVFSGIMEALFSFCYRHLKPPMMPKIIDVRKSEDHHGVSSGFRAL